MCVTLPLRNTGTRYLANKLTFLSFLSNFEGKKQKKNEKQKFIEFTRVII